MTSDTIERLVQQFRTNRTRFNAFCMSLTDEELERIEREYERAQPGIAPAGR